MKELRDLKRLKEKRFQLFSKLKLKNIFPGEWESIYSGEGIEFIDTKPFESGDDPRRIDLRALIGRGEKRIIQRVETRQMKIYVWADFSGSMQYFEEMFFPQKPEINDIAIGFILFSAVKVYSPIGFFSFGLKEKKFFSPRMGERYVEEILDWVISEGQSAPFTSSEVERALSALLQLAYPRNMVFFISDFKQRVFEGDFTDFLRLASSKFDFIPVVIRDPLEKEGELKRSTRVKVRSSSEGQKAREIYLTPRVLQKIQEVSRKHLVNLERNFKKLGIEHIVLDSSSVDDCHRSFSSFFWARRRTRR